MAHRLQVDAGAPDDDAQMHDSSTTAPVRKRPRLDLGALKAAASGGGERRRGKSMFGVLVNTLNKAKAEDKERNASEAVSEYSLLHCTETDGKNLFKAKKRQLIDQRLQTKLKKETDSVRKAEEAKKDKVTALRREEELQLKDSIVSLATMAITALKLTEILKSSAKAATNTNTISR